MTTPQLVGRSNTRRSNATKFTFLIISAIGMTRKKLDAVTRRCQDIQMSYALVTVRAILRHKKWPEVYCLLLEITSPQYFVLQVTTYNNFPYCCTAKWDRSQDKTRTARGKQSITRQETRTDTEKRSVTRQKTRTANEKRSVTKWNRTTTTERSVTRQETETAKQRRSVTR
jgi:hypothetical protein